MPKFIIYYNGLFEKKEIARVDDEQKASGMCYQHNKTIGKWLECGIGNMFYIREKILKEDKKTRTRLRR